MQNQKLDPKVNQQNDDDGPPELEDFTEQLQQMNIAKKKKEKDVYIGDYTDTKNEQTITKQYIADTQKEDQQKLFAEFGGNQGQQYLPTTGTNVQNPPLQSQQQNQISKQEENKKQQSVDFGENFTGGLKKGFLCSDNTNKSSKTKQQNQEQENIVTLKANPNDNKKNKLEIPEVQAAMNLKTTLQANQKQWLNEDLLKSIGSNPQMAKLFTNPEYLQAIAMMEKNPKEVMERYGKNPEFQTILQEFFKLMGGHFNNLSEKEQKEKKLQEQKQQQEVQKQQQNKIQEITPQQQQLQNDPEIQKKKTT